MSDGKDSREETTQLLETDIDGEDEATQLLETDIDGADGEAIRPSTLAFLMNAEEISDKNTFSPQYNKQTTWPQQKMSVLPPISRVGKCLI